MTELLRAIVLASERAASVARACCPDSSEGSLVISEKCNGDGNIRFDKDFKTIADVLAQEAVRHDIGLSFPDLVHQIRGEESSEINGVTISVLETEDLTAELLCKLVPSKAAIRMAHAVHCELPKGYCDEMPKDILDIDITDVGIWIDPIDATAEFIAGVTGEADAEGGLPCVTILIGAYLQSTGEPIIGAINQPFYDDGRLIWAINYQDLKLWGRRGTQHRFTGSNILTSNAEKPEVVDKIKELGLEASTAPGAGNKLMKIALGEAAGYVVSQPTTYLWDTCAPHAILRAKDGDLLSFKTHKPITYNVPHSDDNKAYCNSEGIVAFTDPCVFQKLQTL